MKSLSRITLCLCFIYFVLITLTFVYGSLNYGYLREIHPNQSLTSPPNALDWFRAYGQFLNISIIVLAFLLGAWTSLLGLIRKSYLLGVGALVAGVSFTALMYALLPRYHYLGGDFTAWGYWLAYGFYTYTGSWIIIMLLSFILRRRLTEKTL